MTGSTIPQRLREGRLWSRCRCPPQTCRLAEGRAVQGSRVMRQAPPHCPLLHGGAPPPDHPPAVAGRATMVWVQVFPQTCRLAEGLAGKGHAPGPSPLPHGGAPPPDHPPAVWGRAAGVRVQVLPQTCRLAEDLAGRGKGARLAPPCWPRNSEHDLNHLPMVTADSPPLAWERGDGTGEVRKCCKGCEGRLGWG